MADSILKWESAGPLYLSERDAGGKWEVKADASFTLSCKNISEDPIVIGERGIPQIQLLLPITKNGKQEEDKDIAAKEYLEEITGDCKQGNLTVRKGGVLEETYLSFYLEATADYELEAGGCIEISFHHIQAYCPQESVSHVLCIYKDESPQRVYVPVFKKRSPLDIKEFQIDAAQVGMGDEVTVTWKTLGADSWQILPYARHLGQPAGSTKIRIWESGRLYLMIQRGEEGRQIFREIQVTGQQAIENFTAVPDQAKYEEKVTFQWKLNNARHAYITNGIGYVKGESVTCQPYTCNGNYVLSCMTKEKGRDVLIFKAAAAGREGVLEINMLRFLCTGKSGQKSQYSLNWFVENCREIQLITSDQTERSAGNSMGSVCFEGNQLLLEVICKGDNGQKIHLTQIKAEGENL